MAIEILVSCAGEGDCSLLMFDEFISEPIVVVVGDTLEIVARASVSKIPAVFGAFANGDSMRVDERTTRTVDFVPSVAVVSPES